MCWIWKRYIHASKWIQQEFLLKLLKSTCGKQKIYKQMNETSHKILFIKRMAGYMCLPKVVWPPFHQYLKSSIRIVWPSVEEPQSNYTWPVHCVTCQELHGAKQISNKSSCMKRDVYSWDFQSSEDSSDCQIYMSTTWPTRHEKVPTSLGTHVSYLYKPPLNQPPIKVIFMTSVLSLPEQLMTQCHVDYLDTFSHTLTGPLYR